MYVIIEQYNNSETHYSSLLLITEKMSTFTFTSLKLLLLISYLLVAVQPFSIPTKTKNNVNTMRSRNSSSHSPVSNTSTNHHNNALFMSDDKATTSNDGIVELIDEDDDENAEVKKVVSPSSSSTAAPFLSQGEIQKEALELTNDPKQTRVIIYIIISLVPVLFLVPLMLGSRDLIPLDALPPVNLN